MKKTRGMGFYCACLYAFLYLPLLVMTALRRTRPRQTCTSAFRHGHDDDEIGLARGDLSQRYWQ